jgi:hypothetical protein
MKLKRVGPSIGVIFDSRLDKGFEVETGGVYDFSEMTSLDLLRDSPEGWELVPADGITTKLEG